jgi:glycosyltransferase involved in cell wall biosynthesis
MNPVVSICCITYNHEPYIRDAIEGFLMQKTTFPIEILIFDDASTDGTQEIIKSYAEKDPQIKTFLQKENQWSKGKYGLIDWLFPAAKGKYIALCEGDDYWTDPLKLQKQVDFLEANEDYAICFHPIKIWEDGKIVDDYITKEVQETTTIYDLAEGNYIHTPSVVFRRNEEVFLPLKKINSAIGDYPLHMLNAKYGKIKRLTEFMAVYRVHPGGIFSLKDTSIKIFEWLLMLDEISLLFDEKTNDIIKRSYYSILEDAMSNKNLLSEENRNVFIRTINKNPDYLFDKFEELNKLKIENEELKRSKNSIKKTYRQLLNLSFERLRNIFNK